MKRYIFQLVVALLIFNIAIAQQYDSLVHLKGHAAQLYSSAGYEQRANAIAQRVDKATDYYEKLLGFRAAVTIMVLDSAGWKRYTTMGAVYGMPHYNNTNKTLYVAATNNRLWKSFLPPLDRLPQGLRTTIETVYKDGGNLTMQPFFDQLAIHELGHAFHNQAGIKMQRNWMSELFVNILLHTYTAENEPELLPALTAFPQMVIASGAREYKYTSLQDIEDNYNEVGRNHPKNYGWYQCRWHAAAGKIYDAGGKEVGKRLWNVLKDRKEKMNDVELVALMSASVDKSLADMITNWEKETVK